MAVTVTSNWSIPSSVSQSVQGEIGRTSGTYQAVSSSRSDPTSKSGAIEEINRLQKNILDMESEQIDARYRDQSGLINEQQALLDLQRSQLNPAYADQQRVFAAERALQVARSAEYRLQLDQLNQKKSELAQIQAAEDNVANQAAVAAARRDASVYDNRYGMAGLQVQEIARPLDGTAPENLPPGVRYALETDAQRLGRQFQRNDQNRGLALEGAGLNTTGAGLTVDQQQLTQAQRDAQRQKALALQGFNVSGSQINLNRNDLERDVAMQRQKLALDNARYNQQTGGLESVSGSNIPYYARNGPAYKTARASAGLPNYATGDYRS